MKQRFYVLTSERTDVAARFNKRIASVIAESADEAIRIACMKTATSPDGCTAVEANDGRSPDHFLR